MNIQGLLDKYKDNTEERFFKEVFEKNEYIDARDQKAAVVIDVGALAGEFSAYIYPYAGTIYAIEPFRKYFEELTENIREFELNNIKAFKLAISNRNGESILSSDSSRGGNAIQEDGTGEVVQTVTLASFIKEQGIETVDILKIDIEGHEKKVFEAEDFKEVALRINYIIGEHLDTVIDLLKGYGFAMRVDGANYIFERKDIIE